MILLINQAVILVGGKGKRLGSITSNCPKPMQLIKNKPFLDTLIWNLKRHSIRRIVLLTGYLSETFENYYGDGSRFGISIKYSKETNQAGTGGALKLAEKYLDDYFFLINGDTLFDINYLDLAYSFNLDKVGIMALYKVKDVEQYGTVKISKNLIESFNEKSERNQGYINSGVGIFKKEICNYINKIPSSLEKDIFPLLVKERKLLGKKYNSFFIDIGLPESLKDARRILPNWRKKPALFLDRDGTINKDFGYVYTKKDFKWIKGAKDLIKYANDIGIIVIIITNQSGIARGFYSENDFFELTEDINKDLILMGAHIDATYFCPHHPQKGKGKYKIECNCRKPKSGMFESALNDWKLNIKNCIAIGDKPRDIKAAESLGIKSFLFNSYGQDLKILYKKELDNLI